MATTKAAIARQVKRFRNLPGWPDPDGQSELMYAFAACCDTDEQAAGVAARILETAQFAPVPSAIHKAAHELIQLRRASINDAPSPFDEPGEYGMRLQDGQSEEYRARLKEKVKHLGSLALPTSAQKAELNWAKLMLGMPEDYRPTPKRRVYTSALAPPRAHDTNPGPTGSKTETQKGHAQKGVRHTAKRGDPLKLPNVILPDVRDACSPKRPARCRSSCAIPRR